MCPNHYPTYCPRIDALPLHSLPRPSTLLPVCEPQLQLVEATRSLLWEAFRDPLNQR